LKRGEETRLTKARRIVLDLMDLPHGIIQKPCSPIRHTRTSFVGNPSVRPRFGCHSREKIMRKSVILAIAVAVVIIGGIVVYLARGGIETEQVPGQDAPPASETIQ
jgi:hypothetical protein